MTKVITYGTYDLLHYGHIRLLERAKALGDYLIVGVTADDFDKTRGKINVQQSLMERIEAVRATGIADEIIVEEYEGQKIDDIQKYDIDIFTVGSDWVGTFDYLNEYCKVIYLDRTEGVSSTDLRAKKRSLRLGIVGESDILHKYSAESQFVNGLEVVAYCVNKELAEKITDSEKIYPIADYNIFLNEIDAVYIAAQPITNFHLVEAALMRGKHVLCEAPLTLSCDENNKLYDLAQQNHLVLMEAIKTAYSTAYNRLLLLAKSGRIGNIISVDATCTSLKELQDNNGIFQMSERNSLSAWGPTALLPVFQLLGTNYISKTISSLFYDAQCNFDIFTKIDMQYLNAVASIKVGKGVKSEGELIISGTKGYIYVPAPWWKTDYFEIRYENMENNKRYFYQLDGEGIRNELVSFLKSIESGKLHSNVTRNISAAISRVMEDFNDKNGVYHIHMADENKI